MLDGWRAGVFGVTAIGDFAAPGLEDGPAPGEALAGRDVVVRIVAPEQVALDGDRIWENRSGDESLLMGIDRNAGGYLLDAPGFGRFQISDAGDSILVAPEPVPAWRWQRYLIGQALPFAATLRGVEVFHASAVAVDGRALAVVGPSGAGKTTLAMSMTAAGGVLLCDDVLAIEAAGGSVIAHPGPRIANVRHPAAAALGPRALAACGTVVGEDEEAVRVRLHARTRSVPLGSLFVLDRASEADELEVQPLESGEATVLLASSFNFIVTTRERLTRQLDVCAALAELRRTFTVRVPASMGATALASALVRHHGEEKACAA